jgi:polyisoprenoid-binding protein YceI
MLAAITALVLSASLSPGTQLSLDPSSTLKFHIVHKLHKVEGAASDLEGKAVVQSDGTVLAMARAPVAKFHTGDGNRDGHMIEVLEAGKYPWVVFKGTTHLGPGGELPKEVTMQGEVELHGVKRPVTVPLQLEPTADGVRAKGSFDVSLDAHKIERPSLLFVKIDDACRIDVDFVLKKAGK